MDNEQLFLEVVNSLEDYRLESKTKDNNKTIEIIIETYKNFSIKLTFKRLYETATYSTYFFEFNKNDSLENLFLIAKSLQNRLNNKYEVFATTDMIDDKRCIGFVVVNEQRGIVGLRRFLENNNLSLSLPIGVDIYNFDKMITVDSFASLLIAGAPNSGVNTFLHSMLISLFVSNKEDLQFFLYDKEKEIKAYEQLPKVHKNRVFSNFNDLINILGELNDICEKRLKIIEDAGSYSIKWYNKNAVKNKTTQLARIVVVIKDLDFSSRDEEKKFADLFKKIATKSFKVGVHFVFVTHKTSNNFILQELGDCFTDRVVFKVDSEQDSKEAFDGLGPERLSGAGDLIYYSLTNKFYTYRFQSFYISKEEVSKVIKKMENYYTTKDNKKTLYNDKEYENFKKIILSIISKDFVSATKIQGEFSISYPKSQRIMMTLRYLKIIKDESIRNSKVLFDKVQFAKNGIEGMELIIEDGYNYYKNSTFFDPNEIELEDWNNDMNIIDEIKKDKLFLKIIFYTSKNCCITTKEIQKQFHIGYAKAANYINKMEEVGYIAEKFGTLPRRVLLTEEEFFQKYGDIE